MNHSSISWDFEFSSKCSTSRTSQHSGSQNHFFIFGFYFYLLFNLFFNIYFFKTKINVFFFFVTEDAVRTEMIKQIPDIVRLCHEDTERLHFVIKDHLLPLVKKYLSDSESQVKIYIYISNTLYFSK